MALYILGFERTLLKAMIKDQLEPDVGHLEQAKADVDKALARTAKYAKKEPETSQDLLRKMLRQVEWDDDEEGYSW